MFLTLEWTKRKRKWMSEISQKNGVFYLKLQESKQENSKIQKQENLLSKPWPLPLQKGKIQRNLLEISAKLNNK